MAGDQEVCVSQRPVDEGLREVQAMGGDDAVPRGYIHRKV